MLKRTQTVYSFDNWRYSLLTPERKVYNDQAMSGVTKPVTNPPFQDTILSKSVAEEKRYKESSEAQKALQKPIPLCPPQELVKNRRITKEHKSLLLTRAARLERLSTLNDKGGFAEILDLRVPW